MKYLPEMLGCLLAGAVLTSVVFASTSALPPPKLLKHLPPVEMVRPTPPPFLVLPEMKVEGQAPLRHYLSAPPKRKMHCSLQRLEQGGSPQHPFVGVCVYR